uniref:Uncharacterized protein n=1 Tax=Moniliophthora roreri TaxID=221103 RepID=A0A0W0F1M6_MONRR
MAAASEFPLDVAGAISVWFETLLYGIYTCLFFSYAYLTLRKRMLFTVPSKVFFIGTCIMYANCTAHIALNLYRLLRGYVYLRDSVGPGNYFNDLGRMDNIAHDALNAIQTWMGDSLIIYRCYLVWGNNPYVIILPVLLLVVSIVSNSVALHLFTQVPLGTIFSPTLLAWMNTIYATAFAQNALTTGLIAYRIWRQEMSSRAAGLRGGSSESSLLPAVRIMVESAALYMALLLCLIVLYAQGHNGQFVMQEASVPAIGIVFCLISVRLSLRSYAMWKTTARSGIVGGMEWKEPTTNITESAGFTTGAAVVLQTNGNSTGTSDVSTAKPDEGEDGEPSSETGEKMMAVIERA